MRVTESTAGILGVLEKVCVRKGDAHPEDIRLHIFCIMQDKFFKSNTLKYLKMYMVFAYHNGYIDGIVTKVASLCFYPMTEKRVSLQFLMMDFFSVKLNCSSVWCRIGLLGDHVNMKTWGGLLIIKCIYFSEVSFELGIASMWKCGPVMRSSSPVP